MLTKKEFAELLNIHYNTVDNLIKKGLPILKVDGLIRIDKEKALKWMEEFEKEEK